MSMMLTLIHAGWASVRTSVTQGRQHDATGRLRRLLARPDVPTPVAADANRLLGELLSDAETYADARRHLRAAATLEPAHAHTYYLWGLAHERDPHGCDRRAAARFRHASKLDPANGQYRAAFGRAAIRCGRSKLGIRELFAAADAAPGDLSVIRVVVEGFLEANRSGAAHRVLKTTRFLCRGPAQARELTALFERVRFETARRAQRGERGTTRHRQDANIATDGGRVVLPFFRLELGSAGSPHRSVRRDVVSFPRPHFPRMAPRKADR